MKNVIPALILLMMTWRFFGIHATRILDWSAGRKKRVLSIFFKTLPADDEQEARMEKLWSLKSPGSKNFAYKELQECAKKLINDNHKKWQSRPIAEREELIYHFSNVFATIREPRIEDSNRIADAVIGQYKKYRTDLNMIRSVIYKLLEQRVPHSQESIWTPKDKALLWYIYKAVKSEDGDFKDRIEFRWAQLRPNHYASKWFLERKLREIENEKYKPTREEAKEAKKLYSEKFQHGAVNPITEESTDWKRQWSDERNAQLLCFDEQIRNSHGDVTKNLERRWAQMYGYPSPICGESLRRRARKLIEKNYMPKPENMAKAKAIFDSLPPLEELESKGKSILNGLELEKEHRGRTVFTGGSGKQHHQIVLGHIAIPRVYIDHGIQITREPSHGREFRSLTASSGHSSKQHYQNVPDYIVTPRLYAGHEIQQQQIFDTGYHTANPQNPHEVHSDSSSSDHSIDKYLNLSYQDSDHSAESHHYDLGGTSGH